MYFHIFGYMPINVDIKGFQMICNYDISLCKSL